MSRMLTTLAAIGAALALAAPATTQAASCPTAPDAAALPSAKELQRENTFLGRLGARPTGSHAQRVYINWIRRRLNEIPGVEIRQDDYTIDRWSESSTTVRLRVDGKPRTLPVAGAIPYSKPTTARGVAGRAAYLPDDQPITAANSKGKVVVRPAPAGSVPMADFLLPVVSWNSYDPNGTFDPAANFYGDFINYNARTKDLRDAAAAGAKGLLFVKEIPRAQAAGHYEPYEGTGWGVSGAFVGSDEGKVVTDALTSGHRASIRIVENARFKKVKTSSLQATLPGTDPHRIVVDSHTDGTNAVEDNGPIAMVAMLRYLAKLPAGCRPRTLQFAFSTAHFYQRVARPDDRHGGAGQLAERLDADYDKGTVSSVVVLEHLGALDYEQVKRTDGGPGFELRPNGQRAIQFIAVTPSPSLVDAVNAVVRSYDLQRTILLQGADAPGTTVPQHCSFGGEGTPYNIHLLPTIGVISAPQTLYDPAFELEAIDFGVMHSELLAYTELISRMQAMSQSEIAGSVPLERRQRAAGGTTCTVDS